jgi:hypothetical protein
MDGSACRSISKGASHLSFTNMNKTGSDRIASYSLITVAVLLFAYTFIRACVLSITWDEAFSYLEFVRSGVLFPEKYGDMSANNHLLYTWLEVALTRLFGTTELILRLPSLIAHLLFLVYSAKLVKELNTKWLSFAAFLIINLNPYLLDFFSLARGYGLSMGLMMVSIYYLYGFHKTFANKFAALSVLAAALSVLANYVMLNYCMALCAVLILLQAYHTFYSGEKSKALFFLRNITIPLLIFLLLLLLVVPIGFKLRAAGALFFGGNTGFWKDTVHTIINKSFYELNYNYWFQRLAKAYVVLAMGGASIVAAIRFFRKKDSANVLFLISSILLIGISAMATIAQHYLLGTLYLMDRTALFLMVLFTVMLVFFINELSEERKVLAIIGYASALVLGVHFLVASNLNYTLEWKPDADTKGMLADLEKIKQVPKEKDNISISIPLLFETDINFYRDIKNLTWLNTVARSKKRNPLFEYYYLSQRELAVLNPDSIEILKTYPLTKNVLVRPKFKPEKVHVFSSDALKFENEAGKPYELLPEAEFGKSISYIINDSITPVKNAVIAFRALVKTHEIENNDIMMVISFQHGDKGYSWDAASVRDYVKKADEWTSVYFSCLVPSEARSKDELKIYFWNRNKQQLSVKEMHFNWIDYQ